MPRKRPCCRKKDSIHDVQLKQAIADAGCANCGRVPHGVAGRGPAIQDVGTQLTRPGDSEQPTPCGSFLLLPAFINDALSRGRPLPRDIRNRMETLFAADFSDIRVHVSPAAAALGARAFTFNSTATLNELYQTRNEAWERTKELAGQVAKTIVLWPFRVYYVGKRATESITDLDAGKLVAGPIDAPPGGSHGRIWVRYKNEPDEVGRGFYYEYARDTRGGALVLVEHDQDTNAKLWLRTMKASIPEVTKSPAKHFHVGFYKRAVGSRYTYLPLNDHGHTLTRGAVTIWETNPVVSRESYEIKYLPSHHVYYLDD